MAMQLAIGYRAAGRRNPQGAGTARAYAHVTEHDSISARPAIPHAVITWSDEEARGASLPVGAGDPAVAVDGPPPFRRFRRPPARRFASLDAVMFGVLVVMLLGLAGAVAKVGEQPNTAWAARNPVALAAVGATKVPVVEVSTTRVEAEPAPAVAEGIVPRLAKLASAAKAAGAN
jgi:hypothetical protein